jgi:hypothetical protein
VSNTSPLSNLAILDRLELLREQFGDVLLPGAVRTELQRLPNPTARPRLEAAFEQNWLRVQPLSTPIPQDVEMTLHRGEAETIALALELKADLALLDEADARVKAKQLGLAHTGVLGVLRKARESGRILSLREEIARLRAEARFFVHPALEKEMLIVLGEA